jgi:hypothetical protein
MSSFTDLSMKDYQSSSTMTHKMSFLPPSNKKEFTVSIDGDQFKCDTGLDYNVTMKAINRLREKDKLYRTLAEKNNCEI